MPERFLLSAIEGEVHVPEIDQIDAVAERTQGILHALAGEGEVAGGQAQANGGVIELVGEGLHVLDGFHLMDVIFEHEVDAELLAEVGLSFEVVELLALRPWVDAAAHDHLGAEVGSEAEAILVGACAVEGSDGRGEAELGEVALDVVGRLGVGVGVLGDVGVQPEVDVFVTGLGDRPQDVTPRVGGVEQRRHGDRPLGDHLGLEPAGRVTGAGRGQRRAAAVKRRRVRRLDRFLGTQGEASLARVMILLARDDLGQFVVQPACHVGLLVERARRHVLASGVGEDDQAVAERGLGDAAVADGGELELKVMSIRVLGGADAVVAQRGGRHQLAVAELEQGVGGRGVAGGPGVDQFVGPVDLGHDPIGGPLAGEAVQQVDDVRALVEQVQPARARQPVERAQPALGDDFAKADHLVGVAALVADDQPDAGVLGSVDQPSGFGQLERDRFFNHDRLDPRLTPHLQQRQHDRSPHARRRNKPHHLRAVLVDQPSVVGLDRRAADLPAEGSGALGVEVTQTDEVEPVGGGESLGMEAAALAAADQSAAQGAGGHVGGGGGSHDCFLGRFQRQNRGQCKETEQKVLTMGILAEYSGSIPTCHGNILRFFQQHDSRRLPSHPHEPIAR